MSPPLLHLKDIHLTFGSTPLIEGAELAVSQGDRICLVGRNGSGKSTLLKIAAGVITPESGERFIQPGTTIRYLPQEPDLSGYDSVLAYVEAGLAPGDDPYRATYLLEQVGLTGTEDTMNLSGGEARRAAIAHALAPEPDILLLDEPTNHLDLPAIEWLEKILKGLRTAFVLISHDRRFLETLSRQTVWIDRGVARRIDRGFAHFEEWRDEVLAKEEADRHKLDRKLVAEAHWITYGVTARRKRNQGRLRKLHAMRDEKKNQRKQLGTVKMQVTEAGNSGRKVMEAEDISKSYDGRSIVRDFSTRILRGDRVGIIGQNGAGKTTLLNMLTGALEPDSGTVKLGTQLEMVTLDQRRDMLKPDWTVADALTNGAGDFVEVAGQQKHVVSYMKDFLFLPEQARTPVTVLSGGERGRLMLARALARPSNLLVLDEPTNDLDLETLDLLQEMLADYAGTVLLVSHDRDFLDRVSSSVIVAEGDGHWGEYAGGYSDMLTQRKANPLLADEAEENTSGSGTGIAGAEIKKKHSTGRARKMSYKDKHALEVLPGEMEKLEQAIAAFETKLADASFFTKDPDGFEKTMKGLGKAQEELATSEERWLELEALREEIEG